MPVKTLDFQETIVQQCKKMNNKWSEAVMARISSVHDQLLMQCTIKYAAATFEQGKAFHLCLYQMQMSSQPVSMED